MNYIWACECGHEWECEREDQIAGAVVECQNCKKIWGALRPRKGGLKWIEIDRVIAESPFYDLLSEPENEEEE